MQNGRQIHSNRIARHKGQAWVSRPCRGIGGVRPSDVDTYDRRRLGACGKRERHAAGSAADINHALAGLDPGKGDQLFRQRAAPASDEMLIGLRIGRGVARGNAGKPLLRYI